MLLKYIKKSVAWANSKDSDGPEQESKAKKTGAKVKRFPKKGKEEIGNYSNMIDDPIIGEYRAATIAARTADVRFAAAEARVASVRAVADSEYNANAAAAVNAAKEAIAAMKGDGVNHFGSVEEAEAEYEEATKNKNEAEARARAVEEVLKDDIELASLAYVLAEEDTVEKEIAMTLLEESEIKVVAKKYELEPGYTRVTYKKEKQAVSLAEEDVKMLQELHDATIIEAEEARIQAEKMANFIAEYEEHKEVGLVDKRYKESASEAHKELQEATVRNIEADKELEEITHKLSIEKEEAGELKQRSEIYQEVQDRIIKPLKKAQEAKTKGITLPPSYEHDISDVAARIVTEGELLAEQARLELEAIQAMAKKQSKLGVVRALCGAAASGVIIVLFLLSNEGYYVLGIMLLLSLSFLGMGLKNHYDAVKVCREKEISLEEESLRPEDIEKLKEQSLTQSLSKSLLQSIVASKGKPQINKK